MEIVCETLTGGVGIAAALCGESAAMRQLRSRVERIGPHFRVALVSGEGGVGKEAVARALDAASGDTGGFAAVSRLDDFARARGTLFVREIGEMDTAAQNDLLRVLDVLERRRVGVRLVAATRGDLRASAAAGLFSAELYRRVAEVRIEVPALRDRTEDISGLAAELLREIAGGSRVPLLWEDAIERLVEYPWPGNVRELGQVLREAARVCRDGVIRAEDLRLGASGGAKKQEEEILPLAEVSERYVREVLRRCGGNKLRAAEMLGISRSTLYRFIA